MTAPFFYSPFGKERGKDNPMTFSAVIGVDLGGTQVRAGIVRGAKLSAVESTTVRSRGTEREVLDDVFGVIDALMSDDVSGLGVGVPSVIDLEEGVVYDVQNIPSWKKVPLRAHLESRYGRPVFINNDANCFAVGEKYFGKARPFANAVGLIVGTGLGAGIIADGKLLSGTNCGAGEFGMLPYLEGTFEDYCSGQYFQNVHGISGTELYERAEKNDSRAHDIFAEFGAHLGEAVKAICYAVDPEIIILGGSVSRAYRFFEAAFWKTVRTLAYSLTLANLKIEVSTTENIAILGAASLVYDAAAK